MNQDEEDAISYDLDPTLDLSDSSSFSIDDLDFDMDILDREGSLRRDSPFDYLLYQDYPNLRELFDFKDELFHIPTEVEKDIILESFMKINPNLSLAKATAIRDEAIAEQLFNNGTNSSRENYLCGNCGPIKTSKKNHKCPFKYSIKKKKTSHVKRKYTKLPKIKDRHGKDRNRCGLCEDMKVHDNEIHKIACPKCHVCEKSKTECIKVGTCVKKQSWIKSRPSWMWCRYCPAGTKKVHCIPLHTAGTEYKYDLYCQVIED